jgi:DNA-directed RNA polymerase subunit omega
MINPSMDELLKKVDSKYTLAVFAAKRAREIIDGDSAMVESGSNKAVTLALEEILQGRLVYWRTKTGIK